MPVSKDSLSTVPMQFHTFQKEAADLHFSVLVKESNSQD